jgi:murein DD-endopeptidase MepM/ murein hydrolase activator NlpD
MRSHTGSVLPSVVVRASAVCVLALGVSACSSDTMRFTDAPFSSPFKTAQAPAQAPATGRDPATTGSIGRVASTPLSAPAVASVRSQPLPPPQSAVALRSAAPAAVAGNATGWSAQGGTPIVIAQGETLDTISSRYGVPRAALISANGLSSPNLEPGSRLTIPVYSANAGSAPASRQVAQSTQVQSDARPEPARTLAPPPSSLTHPARVAAPVQDAKAKAHAAAATKAQAAAEAKQAAAEARQAAETRAAAAAETKAKAAADAQAMRESRAKFAAEAKAKAETRKVAVAAKPVVAEAKKAAPVVEKAKPVIVASAPPAEPKVSAIPKSEPAPAPEPKTTASLPKAQPAAEEAESEKGDFRWPARGRVISGFSGKGGNEGINIAVPEGTPIKAAEGGTVAYAGNELKGYGNLVLIRHPNGYVSAYAHNGALNVKRGDAIKRGQVVATAGQTGNVSSPQLHFELRKGSTPVDPTPYLNN